MRRLPALDGLRTFAVLAVIAHHWGSKDLIRVIALGGLGVDLFFVISGFLITGILLGARDETNDENRGSLLGAFYARRALRIFPAYYVVLAIGCLLEAQVRDGWTWHAAYLSNVYIALIGQWPGPISHAWSLAVEEQFYLVWPWIVLFTPRRWLGRAIIAMCLLGPFSRLILMELTGSTLWASLQMPSNLSMLGIGAWLAWRWRTSDEPVPNYVAWISILGTVTSMVVGHLWSAWTIRYVLGGPVMALLFVWLVDRTARGGWGTRWLGLKPLAYVGTVSYSVYLIHNFIPSLTRVISPAAAEWMELRGFWPWLAISVASVAWATLSWTLFEKPLNDLKRYLPYVKRRRAASVPYATTVQPAG